jgi:NAD(P)-dependent dehydrogenase (short-subunit alcohol dehydrogenase family)
MTESTLHTLITGASSGIGREVAVHLSKDRRLILHGRNTERLEETRDRCLNPAGHVIWTYDLRNLPTLAESLASLLAESVRRVDTVVHAAGIVTVLPMRAVDHHVAQEIMNVNFFSAVEIIHVLLKKKVNAGHLANIVFISSIWSRFGAKGHSAYCASKAALDGLMRALAVELAPVTRVNSILPGAIRTAMSEKGFADTAIVTKLKHDYPLGIGEPKDIAEAIDFLLSHKSRWLTGQEIVIDGGRSVNMSLT